MNEARTTTTRDAPGGLPAAGLAEAGRDWWVLVGMTIAAASAAVASFSGLRGLAEAAGWPSRLAWLLPLTIDAYAMTSARVWLAATTPTTAARRFARANALGAITASTAGNAAYHAIGAGLLTPGWPIVVAVGAVPATVLGLTAHLHALRGRPAPAEADRRTATGDGTGDRPPPRPDHRAGDRPQDRAGDGVPSDGRDGTESRTEDRTERRPEDRTRDDPRSGGRDGPESGTEDGPESWTGARPAGRSRTGTRRRRRSRTEDELWAAARDADARHRAEYGRPITRDALRIALRVSGPRATDLRRRLAGTDPAAALDPAAAGRPAAPGSPGSLDPPAADPDPGAGPGSPAAADAGSARTTPDVPDRKEATTP